MNITANALTLTDDADLEILEFDRPAGQSFDFLGFSVHCSSGPVFAPRSAVAA